MLTPQQLRQLVIDGSPEVSLETLDDWELVPFVQDGAVTAVGLIKGCEFHLFSTADFKFRRAEMRAGLQPLLERWGFLVTRVAHNDTPNQRFNKLFGFERTWSDGLYNYYMLTDLPFSRKEEQCQQ